MLNLKKTTSVSSFYKENNFKPCLTKQLLSMFKLWYERGIRLCKKAKFYKIDHRQPTRVKLLCVSAGPLDGNWGSWTPWTRCSQTCGISGGTILKRTRPCNQPPPMNGGKHCVGNDTETARSCFTPCPGLIIIEVK